MKYVVISGSGTGEQHRDFVYVRDVARANILASPSNIKEWLINH
jgi:nucleoside-diphosphate-sugar epimerase|tara:strand:+ start:10892 stop:11023 length:132 start_codon:yes stop_codon:yes gene_type:complete